jgi:diguanylate cyclase (GGDEF)-like protein
LTAAVLALVMLVALDWFVKAQHIGALAILPLLAIARYTRPRTAVCIAVLCAPIFAALDHDAFEAGHYVMANVAFDAIILAVSFVAVVSLVAVMQRRHRQHVLLVGEFERMRLRAEHDRLTALPNRGTFLERLSSLIERAQPSGDRHGVLFCDLDGFKEINDSHGHGTGDAVLALVGERLKSTLRAGDIVGRMGGDEFAVIVKDVRDRNELGAIAAKLDDAVHRPFAIGRRRLSVGLSIGSALFPEDAHDPADLLACADARMYDAKRAKEPRPPSS